MGTDGDIDIVEYFRVIWRHKVSITCSILIAAAIMAAGSFLIPNTYRAEVLMAPAAESGDAGLSSGALGALGSLGVIGGILEGSGLLPGSTGVTAEHLAVLHSRSFVWEFVEQQQLLPELFADEWDFEAATWQDLKNAPTRWDVYELVVEDGLLSVITHEESGLFTLAVEWSDPEKAALWANGLVSHLNAYLREHEKKRTELNLAYLNEELERTQMAEVRQSLFSLITTELNNAMLANTQTEYAFRVLDPAVPPDEQVWPKRILLAAVTGFLAGLVAVFVAFFREGTRRQQFTRSQA
jgi:uncharacterized protein involved in exopolysaccharide biosynthesis